MAVPLQTCSQRTIIQTSVMLTGAKEINGQGTFMVSHRKKKKNHTLLCSHLHKLCIDIKRWLHSIIGPTSWKQNWFWEGASTSGSDYWVSFLLSVFLGENATGLIFCHGQNKEIIFFFFFKLVSLRGNLLCDRHSPGCCGWGGLLHLDISAS